MIKIITIGFIELSIEKGRIDIARRRASIPKLQVYNNALKMVYNPLAFENALVDRKSWGRIVESCIGAYLVSQAFVHRFEAFAVPLPSPRCQRLLRPTR